MNAAMLRFFAGQLFHSARWAQYQDFRASYCLLRGLLLIFRWLHLLSMKIFSALFCILSFSIALNAQQISPQSITSSGATFIANGSEIIYTVGEITVKTLSDGNVNIGQGTISGSVNLNVSTRVVEPSTADLDIRFFPNPVSTVLSANVIDTKDRFLEWTVYDISGKIISSDMYAAQSNRVNFNTSSWKPGTYIMTVSERGGQLLGSYQVIKQ